MKNLIALVLVAVAMSVLGSAFVSDRNVEAKEKPWLERSPDNAAPEVVYEHCCSCDDEEQNGCEEVVEQADKAEFEMSQDRMVQEVELLWDLWFDDEGASPSDSRRSNFTEFAEYLVDAVIMYQQTPTDIGGQLPGHKDDHLLVAYIVAKESSLIPDIVNTDSNGLGEVCLMQLHGKALAGYSKEKVRNNPRLCLLLGTRWLTSHIPKCKESGRIFDDQIEWEVADWIGPLSVYGGGEQRAIKKDGTCAQFQSKKKIVNKVRMFRSRIDHKMQYWEE